MRALTMPRVRVSGPSNHEKQPLYQKRLRIKPDSPLPQKHEHQDRGAQHDGARTLHRLGLQFLGPGCDVQGGAQGRGRVRVQRQGDRLGDGPIAQHRQLHLGQSHIRGGNKGAASTSPHVCLCARMRREVGANQQQLAQQHSTKALIVGDK
jgi:hypothetical protein